MSECRTETGRKAGGNMSFDEAVDELKRILDGLRAAVLTDLTAAPSKISKIRVRRKNRRARLFNSLTPRN